MNYLEKVQDLKIKRKAFTVQTKEYDRLSNQISYYRKKATISPKIKVLWDKPIVGENRQKIQRRLRPFMQAASSGKFTAKKYIKHRRIAQKLLGCSLEDFFSHIETLLQRRNWSWSDWKKVWTLDHVVPVKNFILPMEKFACWNYTNLRPLLKEVNMNKKQNVA